MLVSPGEIALNLGILQIHYYGIIMALSLSLGVFFSSFVTRKFYPDINPELILDISPHIIIGGIFGARIYYCLVSFSYYSQHLNEIPMIWQGGLSIHGGIFGGLLAGLLYAKRHKLPILKLCDIFSYGIVLGQALGRWGNFFNSEAFGRPTECFIKLYIPIYKRPLQYMQYDFFHPTFLYESILDILIFVILYFGVRKITNKKDGIIFYTYLILYSIARIIVEYVRIDSVLNVFGIPVAQIISFIIIIASVIALFFISNKQKQNN